MKIAILTLPLHSNYGGILQAWALQETLKRLGHEVVVLNYKEGRVCNLYFPLVVLHRAYLRFFKKMEVPILGPIYHYALERNIRPFVNEHMGLSRPLGTEADLTKYIVLNHIEAVVIGSDQVWRPGAGLAYFASFLNEPTNVRRIAYAASFGCDDPHFANIDYLRAMLDDFASISVREQRGVDICKSLFGLDVECMPDPTMLLPIHEYDNLSSKAVAPQGKYILGYFLTSGQRYMQIAEHVAQQLRLPLRVILTEEQLHHQHIPHPMISVQDWVATFKHAEYVITDSFHGATFSLLYRHSFAVIDNRTGSARIATLLNTFNMSNRLVADPVSPSCITKALLDVPSNDNEVEEKLRFLRSKAITFLQRALNRK